MSSRDDMLRAIRAHALPDAPLPKTTALGVRYDDPTAQFVKLVEAVGGAVLHARDAADADAQIRQLEVFQTSQRRYSNLPGIGESTFDLDALARPHELAGTGVSILGGEFAVAENGAVWATDAGLKHRAIYFISEYLVLVVPARELVHNMHDAYARLSFENPAYGLFISGPSKTADIEQSLVIGAQGPRSLHVVLLGD